MGNISPGGKNIIFDAFKKANIKNGSDVLDIGCGDGSTLASLKEEFEISAVGIDKSAALIKQGQEKYCYTCGLGSRQKHKKSRRCCGIYQNVGGAAA